MAKICTLCHGVIRFGDVKHVCETCWTDRFCSAEGGIDPIDVTRSIDPNIFGSDQAEWVEWECVECSLKDRTITSLLKTIELDTELQEEQADKIADLRTSLKIMEGKLKKAKDELNELKDTQKESSI